MYLLWTSIIFTFLNLIKNFTLIFFHTQTISREPIDICCKLEKLYYLGEGYPLFYSWLTYAIYLLTILFVFFSVPAFITNLQSNYCATP